MTSLHSRLKEHQLNNGHVQSSSKPKIYGKIPVVDDVPYVPVADEAQFSATVAAFWSHHQNGYVGAKLVAVQGESGCGKSTLLARFVRHQTEESTLLPGLEAVFWLHSHQFEASLPGNSVSSDMDRFLAELGDLFRPHITRFHHLPVNTSSIALLRKSLGFAKRYLLIIDDVTSGGMVKIANIACQLFDSTRCIVVVRNSVDLLKAHAVAQVLPWNLVIDVVSISPTSSSFGDFSDTLPESVRTNDLVMKQFNKLSRGLPLVAKAVTSVFRRRDHSSVTPNDSSAFNELMQFATLENRPANLLRFVMRTSLKHKDRQRYYAFLLFKPGHPFRLEVLSWFWQKSIDGSKRVCLRLESAGLIQRIEDTSDGFWLFSITAYFHEAASQDAMEHFEELDSLESLRLKILKGRLMIDGTLSRFVNKVQSMLHLNKGDHEVTSLELGIQLHDWSLAQVVCFESRNQLDETLISKFYQDPESCSASLLNLYQLCASSRLAQFTFLNLSRTCLRPKIVSDLGKHSLSIVYYLAERKICVNEWRSGSETALMTAAKDGELPAVKFLINEGKADLTLRNNDGATAILVAAKFGHLEVVKYLHLECDANLLDDQDSYGRDALMLAAKFGHLDVVRYCIEAGLKDFKKGDFYGLETGFSAIQLAVRCGHLDVVAFLMPFMRRAKGEHLWVLVDLASTKTPFCDGYREAERREVCEYLKDLIADVVDRSSRKHLSLSSERCSNHKSNGSLSSV